MIVETLIIFFFGFPGAFLSLLVSIIGIVQNKYWLVLIGVLLFLPFTYYLYGAPGILSNYVFLLRFYNLAQHWLCIKRKEPWRGFCWRLRF